MDAIVAKRMEEELSGKSIAGWELGECIGHGKSALVFRGTRGDAEGAVKVFDRELVERLGKDAQRERVRRESGLIGKTHPNLIEILDAGEDAERTLFYVVMALAEGPNLDEARGDVPIDQIQSLVAQIAEAAQFLECHGVAHRDIKPENIGVSPDFSKATLLDLGVVRPIGLGNVTDGEEQRNFVGTLRYSPPELLFREEVDSTAGWRAVTFYQLGGVLHDLIMRRPLFAGVDMPYARLVEAVRSEIPVVVNPAVCADLVLLASNCLVKSPETRLALVNWQAFSRRASEEGDADAARSRIRSRIASVGAQASRPPTAPSVPRRLSALAMLVERAVREVAASGLFPPMRLEVHTPVSFHVCIGARFSSSVSRAVHLAFTPVLVLSVVDAAANAVRIIGGVQVGEAEECSNSTIDGLCLFEGVVDEGIVHQRVADYMVLALDAVQQVDPAASVDGEWLRLAPREGV